MECDNKSVVQGAAPVKGDVPRFAAATSYRTPEFCIAATLSPLITGANFVPGYGSMGRSSRSGPRRC